MIRVYFEAIEQGLHFLLPAVKKALGLETEVQLIKLSRISRTSTIARMLMPSLGFKDPDGIITVIKDGIEIPLLWIEISTSVETQDHVLQRFDSQMASGFAKIPFIKIQARRVSRSDHGGQTNFDFKETFQILYREFGITSAQLEWPLNEDSTVALRDENYKACPPSDLGLSGLISATFEGVMKGLSANESLILWAQENPHESLALEIAENQLPLSDFSHGTRSTRFYESNGRYVIKFNRWGHAMDPERGMAWYFSNRVSQKLIGRIHCKESKSISDAAQIFSQSTGIRVTELVDGTSSDIDISEIVNMRTYNRSGLAIVANCSEFTVADDEGTDLIRFWWQPLDDAIPIPKCELGDTTTVVPYEEIGEDEVTFVAATRFFPANSISVQSVSYPGAQGDFALVQGNGRAALRTYIDLIGLKFSDGLTKAFLVESKGSRARDKLSEDALKVASWRDEQSKASLLKSNLGENDDLLIYAGTAYPGAGILDIPESADLDFTLVVNRENWVVWAPIGGKATSEFEVADGKSELPRVFEY
jgi:hypothetical protein